MKKNLDYQIQVGFLLYNQTTDQYSPSIKGALIMTRKNCFPILQFRKWRSEEINAAILKQLRLSE